MKESGIRQKINNLWLNLTIKKKILVFMGTAVAAIFLSVLFDLWVVKFSLFDFRNVLEDNAKSSDYMTAMEAESKCFEQYVKNPVEQAKEELNEACLKTKRAVEELPYDYASMSPLRYAKTWSIKNSYETYAKERDFVLQMEEGPEYIDKLYRVYDMQTFLEEYARNLMRYTLEDENVVYEQRLPVMKRIPLIGLLVGAALFLFLMQLARLMYGSIVIPIVDLVAVSKKIASNDFFVEDVSVNNQDEMGDLVQAFNKMKYATGQYITAMEEKRKTLDLLHREEVERLDIEKRLETTKLELLKSQIDPHFLFNTLNVIGGMANLEDAQTTEKMIKALSALFRYNLKTPDPEVFLSQELKIVKDYMYLQQMRFGNRFQYEVECELDAEAVMVPTFSFQPLVENSIIHGLSRKEEGGSVKIRIWRVRTNLFISVSDTGTGMKEEELERLQTALEQEDTAALGIGLGNLYKRIKSMYKDGEMEISSDWGEGTEVKLKIPQKEWKEH